MKKFIISLCVLPFAFQLLLIVNSVYAHTHNTQSLSREEKIVAITILAEARGEGEKGMYAVGAVIAQRAFERKQTPTEVCLKKWQFSCWNGKKLKVRLRLLVKKLLCRLGRPLVVGDSQVVFGNRVLIKGNFNHSVNVAGQHFVSVDVFFQHDAVVVLVNHLLLGCAKRVSAA